MTNLLHKYDRACHVVVKWASALGKGGNLGTSIVYGTTHTFVSHIYNSECFTQFITFYLHHSPVRQRLSSYLTSKFRWDKGPLQSHSSLCGAPFPDSWTQVQRCQLLRRAERVLPWLRRLLDSVPLLALPWTREESQAPSGERKLGNQTINIVRKRLHLIWINYPVTHPRNRVKNFQAPSFPCLSPAWASL